MNRKAYLKAMGITCWQRRALLPTPPFPPPPASPRGGEAGGGTQSISIRPTVSALEVTPASDTANAARGERAMPSAMTVLPLAATFAESPPTPLPLASPPTPELPTARSAVPTPTAAIPTALDLNDDQSARSARIAGLDWNDLQIAVRDCTACGLHAGRTQAVFGVGYRHAEWLIIGEAPGADEDRLGEPFVGRAGQLLDAMLFALHLDRNTVYIANILKCRPPNNRTPTPEEAHCCRPFLHRQIALLKPKILLAVGAVAAQQLLNTTLAVSKLRGQIFYYEPGHIPLVVTYHPAYLLRSPREKRRAWDDLQRAYRVFSDLKKANN